MLWARLEWGDPRACPLKVDDELGLVPAWQAAALTLCLNCMQALPDLTVTANASAHSLTQHQNEHAVLSDLRPRFTGVAGCSKAPARNACARIEWQGAAVDAMQSMQT